MLDSAIALTDDLTAFGKEFNAYQELKDTQLQEMLTDLKKINEYMQ